MSPARARIQIAWSRDEHTNHEITMPESHMLGKQVLQKENFPYYTNLQNN